MSERDDISAWKDRADTSETRDWDIPFTGHGESAEADVDEASRSGRPDPGGPDRGDVPESPLPPARGEPPDESEKRDWDIP